MKNNKVIKFSVKKGKNNGGLMAGINKSTEQPLQKPAIDDDAPAESLDDSGDNGTTFDKRRGLTVDPNGEEMANNAECLSPIMLATAAVPSNLKTPKGINY